MYRIKPKKGYNVVLKDMGLVLRTEKDEWVEVDEELFNNSNDAKRLKDLIIIEGQENKIEKVKDVQPKSKQDAVYSVPENAFVVGTRTYKNPDDVFVKTQNDIVDPITQVTETSTELIKKDVEVKAEKTVIQTETVEKPEAKVKSEKVEKTTKTEKTKIKVTDTVEDNKSKEENVKKENKKNKK